MSTARTLKLAVGSVIAVAALLAPGTASAATRSAAPPFPPGVQIGTPKADVLVGSQRADIIFGLGGDDHIYGRQGDDQIFGGAGDDWIYGGAGRDTLRGGPGVDHIFGGAGNDLIFAAGDGSADVISCGDGHFDMAIVDPSDQVAKDCEFVWVRDPDNN